MLTRKLIIIHGDGKSGIELDLMHEFTKADWQVFIAHQFAQAQQLLSTHEMTAGLVYLDDIDEFSPELHEILLANNHVEWIALAQPRTYQLPHVRQMVAELFHDYHSLPADHPRLLMTLGHAHGKATMRKQWLAQRATQNHSAIIGECPAMRQIINSLHKIANTTAPALISGESGSGKQLTARTIHQYSDRATLPFISVNCATIPQGLIQAELFGSEQSNIKIGRIEAANRGTLYISDIDSLPLDQQALLLRFLQTNQVERIGGLTAVPVDTRVIAATNIDLEKAVKEGKFREDLYYRINVLRIKIPALRERDNDVDILARHFLEKLSRENRGKAKGFSQRAVFALRAYQWPGNVRDLINRIRNAIIMSESRLISPTDLGLEESVITHSSKKLDHARNQTEHELIRSTLRHNGNNVSQSAKQLGISRATLYRLISKFPENQKNKSS